MRSEREENLPESARHAGSMHVNHYGKPNFANSRSPGHSASLRLKSMGEARRKENKTTCTGSNNVGRSKDDSCNQKIPSASQTWHAEFQHNIRTLLNLGPESNHCCSDQDQRENEWGVVPVTIEGSASSINHHYSTV